MRSDYVKLLHSADAAVAAGLASGRIGSDLVYVEFAEPGSDRIVARAKVVSQEERLGRLLYFAACPRRPDEYPASLPFLPDVRVRLLETSTLPAGPVLAWPNPCDPVAGTAALIAQSEAAGWKLSDVSVPFPPGITYIELSDGRKCRQIMALEMPPPDFRDPIITMGHRFAPASSDNC